MSKPSDRLATGKAEYRGTLVMSPEPMDGFDPPEASESSKSPESDNSEQEATDSSFESDISLPPGSTPSQTDTLCLCLSKQQYVDLEQVISCSNRECNYPLFHLRCVGLVDHLPARLTWFCPECRKMDRLVCLTNGISMAKGAKGVGAYVRVLDEGTRQNVEMSMRNRPVEMIQGRTKKAGQSVEGKDVKRKRKVVGMYKERVLENMRGRHDDNKAAQVDDSSTDDGVIVETRRAKRRNLVDLKTRRSSPQNGHVGIDMSAWRSPWWPRYPGLRIATPDGEKDPVSPRGKVVAARDNLEPEPTHDTPINGPLECFSSFGGEQDLEEEPGLSFRLRGMEH